MAYTSDDIVTAIQRVSYLPAAQRNFPAATLLNIADDEILGGLAPLLVSLQQGYFEEDADQTLTVNQRRYDYDQYAMFGKFRHIELVDSAGVPYRMVQITEEQVIDYGVNVGRPTAFLPEQAQLAMYPLPDNTYTLRQKIYRRPGRLVPTASAAQVQSVDTNTGIVTYTGAKPTTTFTASSSHDFYRGNYPFRRVGTNIAATGSGSGTTQTFSLANAALLQAGDWVCVVNETVFPAIPIELHPSLVDLVVKSLTRTQGDQQQYQTQRAEIIAKAQAIMVMGNRAVGNPKRVSIPPSRVTPNLRRTWFT